MNDTLVIVLIAIGVCAIACAVHFWRLFMDGRRLRRWLKGQELRERDVDPPTFVKFSPPGGKS